MLAAALPSCNPASLTGASIVQESQTQACASSVALQVAVVMGQPQLSHWLTAGHACLQSCIEKASKLGRLT